MKQGAEVEDSKGRSFRVNINVGRNARRGGVRSDVAVKKELKGSDRYETPQEIFDYWDGLFNFHLDVCAEPKTAKCLKYFTPDTDALIREWGWPTQGVRCWSNPPYSNPRPWIEKAKAEQAQGVFTCMLLPSDTSTAWYQELVHNQPGIVEIPLRGRIRFLLDGKRADSPKFGNIIALFLPLNGEGKRLP